MSDDWLEILEQEAEKPKIEPKPKEKPKVESKRVKEVKKLSENNDFLRGTYRNIKGMTVRGIKTPQLAKIVQELLLQPENLKKWWHEIDVFFQETL